MPLYAYKCHECGVEFDRRLSLSNSSEPQTCECGGDTYKDLSKTNVAIDQTEGCYDHGLGEYIDSSSDRRRIMKEKGLIDVSAKECFRAKPRQRDDKGYEKIFEKASDELRTVKINS